MIQYAAYDKIIFMTALWIRVSFKKGVYHFNLISRNMIIFLKISRMKNVHINLIDPNTARLICRLITATLPEWFGIPDANLRYAHGMLSRISFAASIDDNYIGLITIEFPSPTNATIYWMAVSKAFQNKSVGKKLLRKAEQYCYEQGYSSLTVETLSPKQNIVPTLKLYYFYERCGFKPLFEMHTYGPGNLMVYMQKTLSFEHFAFIDLTHTLSFDIPTWNHECGFENKIESDYDPSSAELTFRTQHLKMRAGIGTHMDAPAHCVPAGLSIADIPLRSLITPCCVVDVSDRAHDRYSVTVDDVQRFEYEFGRIQNSSVVIFYTGWSQWWSNPEKYRNDLVFPSVSKEVADYLLHRDVAGIGIDTLSPDSGGSGYPVHQLMLGAGKYLIENVANANELDATGNYLIALPLKIQGGTEAPMRLVGLKPK